MPCNRLNIEFKPPRNTPRLRGDDNPREWAALHQNIGECLHRRCVSSQSLIDLEARAIEPPARLTRSAPCRRDALAFSPCERAPCRLRWTRRVNVASRSCRATSRSFSRSAPAFALSSARTRYFPLPLWLVCAALISTSPLLSALVVCLRSRLSLEH